VPTDHADIPDLEPPPPLPFRGLREFDPENEEHVRALAAHHRHEAARYAVQVDAIAKMTTKEEAEKDS
jgi:hypothetical protein